MSPSLPGRPSARARASPPSSISWTRGHGRRRSVGTDSRSVPSGARRRRMRRREEAELEGGGRRASLSPPEVSVAESVDSVDELTQAALFALDGPCRADSERYSKKFDTLLAGAAASDSPASEPPFERYRRFEQLAGCPPVPPPPLTPSPTGPASTPPPPDRAKSDASTAFEAASKAAMTFPSSSSPSPGSPGGVGSPPRTVRVERKDHRDRGRGGGADGLPPLGGRGGEKTRPLTPATSPASASSASANTISTSSSSSPSAREASRFRNGDRSRPLTPATSPASASSASANTISTSSSSPSAKGAAGGQFQTQLQTAASAADPGNDNESSKAMDVTVTVLSLHGILARESKKSSLSTPKLQKRKGGRAGNAGNANPTATIVASFSQNIGDDRVFLTHVPSLPVKLAPQYRRSDSQGSAHGSVAAGSVSNQSAASAHSNCSDGNNVNLLKPTIHWPSMVDVDDFDESDGDAKGNAAASALSTLRFQREFVREGHGRFVPQTCPVSLSVSRNGKMALLGKVNLILNGEEKGETSVTVPVSNGSVGRRRGATRAMKQKIKSMGKHSDDKEHAMAKVAKGDPYQFGLEEDATLRVMVHVSEPAVAEEVEAERDDEEEEDPDVAEDDDDRSEGALSAGDEVASLEQMDDYYATAYSAPRADEVSNLRTQLAKSEQTNELLQVELSRAQRDAEEAMELLECADDENERLMCDLDEAGRETKKWKGELDEAKRSAEASEEVLELLEARVKELLEDLKKRDVEVDCLKEELAEVRGKYKAQMADPLLWDQEDEAEGTTEDEIGERKSAENVHWDKQLVVAHDAADDSDGDDDDDSDGNDIHDGAFPVATSKSLETIPEAADTPREGDDDEDLQLGTGDSRDSEAAAAGGDEDAPRKGGWGIRRLGAILRSQDGAGSGSEDARSDASAGSPSNSKHGSEASEADAASDAGSDAGSKSGKGGGDNLGEGEPKEAEEEAEEAPPKEEDRDATPKDEAEDVPKNRLDGAAEKHPEEASAAQRPEEASAKKQGGGKGWGVRGLGARLGRMEEQMRVRQQAFREQQMQAEQAKAKKEQAEKAAQEEELGLGSVLVSKVSSHGSGKHSTPSAEGADEEGKAEEGVDEGETEGGSSADPASPEGASDDPTATEVARAEEEEEATATGDADEGDDDGPEVAPSRGMGPSNPRSDESTSPASAIAAARSTDGDERTDAAEEEASEGLAAEGGGASDAVVEVAEAPEAAAEARVEGGGSVDSEDEEDEGKEGEEGGSSSGDESSESSGYSEFVRVCSDSDHSGGSVSKNGSQ